MDRGAMRMETMKVSVPEPLKHFVDELIARGDYPDASAYLLALIERDQLRREPAQIEAKLLEGVESGEPTPLTAEDWDELRRACTNVRPRARADEPVGRSKATGPP
jgi:antitoxin ParD1/3/4